jgi:hypothetical protein
MPRLILICSFAATLAACATRISDANKSSWAQENLACADAGIDPGSPIFGQCVTDLHQSIWAAHYLDLGN